MSTDPQPVPVPIEEGPWGDMDIADKVFAALEQKRYAKLYKKQNAEINSIIAAHTSLAVAEAVQSRDAQIVVLLANLKEAQDTADTWFQRLSEMGCELTRDGSWRNVRAEMAVQSRDAQIVALRDKILFVFDVESIGLHGEGFSVGWVVVKNGVEFEASYVACDRSLAKGGDGDRAWVDKNVPIQPSTHASPQGMRNAFWQVWRQWQANGAILIADCAWPVEARFLAQCIDDDLSGRYWDGPYPLHDAASIILARGGDPLATNERKDNEKPAHNPLCDARQTARLISCTAIARAGGAGT